MNSKEDARETKPSGLQPQHGSGTYLLMVNNSAVFSATTTKAICIGVLVVLAGMTLVPAGMLPSISAYIAASILLFGCFVGWVVGYLCDKSNFPILAGGMRMAGTLIGVAGIGLMGAPTLSLERATVLATLLLSAIAGIISMNVWKEVMLRAGAPDGALRFFTAHWWHLAFGGLIFAIILSPFTLPAMFREQTIFLVARLVPLLLGTAMALALIERSRAYAGMRHIGERVAALGLAAQLALLVSINPLSPAWGVALLLVFSQIFTVGQWLLTYQLTKSTGAQAKAYDLSLQNDQLRQAAIAERQQILQAMRANDAKTYETLNLQREQWQREILAVSKRYEGLRRDFVSFKEQISRASEERQATPPDVTDERVSSLANIMHDLTHPATAIMGSSQLIMLRLSSGRYPELTRQAQTLYSYSRRLILAVKFVLDYDKDMQPIFQSFDLVLLLRDLTKDEQTIQPLRSITFVPMPPPGETGTPLPHKMDVAWERDRIEAVLFNLLDNAEKYSRPGTPIMIRAWLTADSSAIAITVRDCGTGMSATTRQRIFDRSYRSDPNARISGHGLGLWMVKTIVALHHGEIDVTSAEGEGTTMRLTIPRVMPDNQDEPHQ